MSFRLASLPVLALCLALGGCMGAPGLSEPAAEEDLSDAPVTPQGFIAGRAAPDTPICPAVEVFEGGAAMRGRRSGQGASGVDYQVAVNDVARECRNDGASTTMRIGVRGRVVLGTVGQPGSYTVPLRITVRRIGGDTLYNNLVRLSVTVGAEGGASFQHVEENIVVPQPPIGEDIYEVLVGVDPTGGNTAPRKRRS